MNVKLLWPILVACLLVASVTGRALASNGDVSLSIDTPVVIGTEATIDLMLDVQNLPAGYTVTGLGIHVDTEGVLDPTLVSFAVDTTDLPSWVISFPVFGATDAPLNASGDLILLDSAATVPTGGSLGDGQYSVGSFTLDLSTLPGNAVFDFSINQGSVNLAQIPFYDFHNGSLDDPFSFDALEFANAEQTVEVPEPASLLLMGLGGMLVIRRRR